LAFMDRIVAQNRRNYRSVKLVVIESRTGNRFE